MSFTKQVAAGSEILTQTKWNNQMNDIGSYFDYTNGLGVGSLTLVYSGTLLVSGLGRFENQSYDTRYIYNASGNVASGVTAYNGRTLTSVYVYSGTNLDLIRVNRVIV